VSQTSLSGGCTTNKQQQQMAWLIIGWVYRKVIQPISRAISGTPSDDHDAAEKKHSDTQEGVGEGCDVATGQQDKSTCVLKRQTKWG